MDISLTTGQPGVTLIVDGFNQNHDHMTLPEPPTWSSSDESVARVSASSDSLSAVVSQIAPGTATITVSDAGLTATANVTVIAGSVLTTLELRLA